MVGRVGDRTTGVVVEGGVRNGTAALASAPDPVLTSVVEGSSEFVGGGATGWTMATLTCRR